MPRYMQAKRQMVALSQQGLTSFSERTISENLSTSSRSCAFGRLSAPSMANRSDPWNARHLSETQAPFDAHSG
eukprot:427701-Pyramimonas_sp.AAC.1